MLRKLFKSSLEEYFSNAEEIFGAVEFKDWEADGCKFLDMVIPHSVKLEIRNEKKQEIVEYAPQMNYVYGFDIDKPEFGSKVILIIVFIKLKKYRSSWCFLTDILELGLVEN